jgi:hypothetical protein
MMTVFLVDLEAVESRYTGQWKTHVPALLQKAGHNVHVISGPTDIPSATTPGAFLNFGGTNIYKANQVEQMGRLFTEGRVTVGDHFLFTDAWHPGIINLKYMSELLGIKVKIHALWHAGSYDPQDFLGRLIGDAPWVRHAEKSFFASIDYNYFATNFHIDMFCNNLLDETLEDTIKEFISEGKIIRTGWPMEYMPDVLTPYKKSHKRDLILFPHRIAPEKQLDIFKDLASHMPEYEWVICQEQTLTKDEYHRLLGQAKMVFSANLQETLGISMYEGALVGAMPLVPDRLSYKEMYSEKFKYPSHWTLTWKEYTDNRIQMIRFIRNHMQQFDLYSDDIQIQADSLTKEFFSATKLLENIK